MEVWRRGGVMMMATLRDLPPALRRVEEELLTADAAPPQRRQAREVERHLLEVGLGERLVGACEAVRVPAPVPRLLHPRNLHVRARLPRRPRRARLQHFAACNIK